MYLAKKDTFYKSSLIAIKTCELIKTFYTMDTAIKCTLTFTIGFFYTKDEKCFLCAMKVGCVFFDTHCRCIFKSGFVAISITILP